MRWRRIRFPVTFFLPRGRIERSSHKDLTQARTSCFASWPVQGLGSALLILGLVLCSCATVPAPLGPLASEEVRLLRLESPTSEILANIQYVYTIQFEADDRPRITRVCFYWSGDGPYCVRPKKVEYGSPGIIEVELRATPPGTSSYGTYELEAFVEYVREGKSTRTNSVAAHISVFLK